MMDYVQALLQIPAVQGGLTGLGTAAWADFVAFRQWKRWGEFVTFDWSLATFRWFQGFVVGAVLGGGIGAVNG